MPNKATVHPYAEGYALLSWDLGPYYHLCPLNLQPIRGKERRAVPIGGYAYSLGINVDPTDDGGSKDAALQIFNEWWDSLRQLVIYVIREHGVPGYGLTEPLGRELRAYDLQMHHGPDHVSMAVPPSVSDDEATSYAINVFQQSGYPVERGNVGNRTVIFVHQKPGS